MNIRTRTQWGARHANGAGPAPLPATEGVALHHSVTPAVNGDQAIRNLEAIGQARFGAGMSYTFPITPDGQVYEGHSVDRRGTHTGGHNSTIRAICLVGNYDAKSPTPQQIESAAQLLAHGVRSGWWPTTRLRGHRDFKSTACPGAKAYACIPTIVTRADAILAGKPTPPTTGGLTVADIDTILKRLDNIELRLTELQAHVVHPDRTKPAKDQGGIERTLSSLARIEGALKPKAGA